MNKSERSGKIIKKYNIAEEKTEKILIPNNKPRYFLLKIMANIRIIIQKENIQATNGINQRKNRHISSSLLTYLNS